MLEKLKEYEGEVFYTVKGYPFTYKFIKENVFVIIREGRVLNRQVYYSSVEKAIAMNPKKVSDIGRKIIAGSYIFALITDRRMIC